MKLIAVLFVGIIPCLAFAGDEQWQLDIDVDGVKVWTQEMPGSRYKQARGEIVVTASPQKAFAVIVSAETCRQWVYSCVESYVVSRPVPQDGIVYMRTNSLWPIADRDVLFLAKTSFDAAKQEYHAELSKHSDVVPPVEGVVRIGAMVGSWTVTGLDEKSSRVVFWSHVEPGGLLPAALVNFALGRLHQSSLLKLREYLKQGD
ncbi:hypothetical protein EBR21_15920 [bacterium]|nr:hypothetical protein [bacterium]